MSGPLRPVSSAFLVPDGPEFDVVRAGLRYIDSAHLDGLLPPIVVRRGPRATPGTLGYLDFTSMQLFVFEDCGDDALARTVLYHEVGHILDAFGLPGADSFAFKSQSPLMEHWAEAVYRSRAMMTLMAAISELQERAPTARILNGPLVGTVELWARSYAQYKAMKSGDSEALNVLHQHSVRLAGGAMVRSHWSADDFLPVYAEIDEVIRRAGWLP